MQEVNYASIGNRIRIARLEKGMTQAELGEAAGCSNNYMSHIETGQTKVSLKILLRISRALEYNIDYFLLDTPYVLPQTLVSIDISKKLDKCTSKTLITLNKILDILIDSQDKDINPSE